MAFLLYRASTTPSTPGSTSAKGSALSNLEIDGNFKSLNDELSADTTILNAATSSNTANTIVKRDVSGNFTAGVVSATDFNTTSDITLKENLAEIDSSSIIGQVNPVKFNWKDSGKVSYGVIAQELENILPELVSDRDNIKEVSYIPLIAVLLDAVKKLDQRVKELEQR